MSDKVQVSGGGIEVFGLLGVLFVGLKLGGVIAWPWLWVLAPFWIPWAILLGILLVIAIVGLIIWLFQR